LSTSWDSALPNKALQQTGLSVASLPLAPAAERQYVWAVDKMSTTRTDAIERLALSALPRLSSAERAEQLQTMTLEDWSDSPGWSTLPADVRAELETQAISYDPSSQRYDAVLLLWLRFRYSGATNSYLRGCLERTGVDEGEVIGREDERVPCPCCGRATISERGHYEICKVCWWEDDGQDNAKADTVMGGPNYGLSLTQGRANFLLHGISDPGRDDLRAHQDPREKYAIGRVFRLSPHGEIEEPALQWTSRAFAR